MTLQIWVAHLDISARTAGKIASKHSISPEDVEQAVVCVAGLDFVWDQDAVRGERAIVSVRIRDRPALVVLYDAGHPLGDVWNLGSVSPIRSHITREEGMMPDMRDEFYEDDEPLAEIRAKFAQGQRGVTQPRPSRGQTHYLSISGLAPASDNRAARELTTP